MTEKKPEKQSLPRRKILALLGGISLGAISHRLLNKNEKDESISEKLITSLYKYQEIVKKINERRVDGKLTFRSQQNVDDQTYSELFNDVRVLTNCVRRLRYSENENNTQIVANEELFELIEGYYARGDLGESDAKQFIERLNKLLDERYYKTFLDLLENEFFNEEAYKEGLKNDKLDYGGYTVKI